MKVSVACVRVGLAVFLLASVSAEGNPQLLPDQRAYQDLLAARSLKCVFPWFATADWDRDEPQLRSSQKQEFEFHIDGIDHKRNAARLIGNAGAEDLIGLTGSATISFIERVPAGSVNVTTVYAWQNKDGRFKAVHSRHIAIGGPAPSQNYGYCQVW